MNHLGLVFLLVLSFNASAAMPTNPVSDPEFMRLPDGTDLSSISVSGRKLSLTYGSGGEFTASARAKYEQILNDSLTKAGYPVQWTLMDLDSHMIIRESLESRRRFFGASVSKIFVAATLLDQQTGTLTRTQKDHMARMLVVSSNTAWTELQRQIGGGNSNLGRERIHAFTGRMGYSNTRGFQGSWGSLHGNELNAQELAEFLHDSYKGEYLGAEAFWKLIHTSRTGSSRARKYIPRDVIVGGKTGTYDGATQVEGASIRVRVRNHVIVFNVGGRQYALTILADTGSDETAAVLAGGLLRDFTSYRPPAR